MASGVLVVEIGHDRQLTLFHVRAFEDAIEMGRKELARLVPSQRNRAHASLILELACLQILNCSLILSKSQWEVLLWPGQTFGKKSEDAEG